eukprot:s1692_g14.t1
MLYATPRCDLELADVARSPSSPEEEMWILSARKVSIISILVSVVLALLGFSIGFSENVLSVIGFGMEAALDGISSALVLWRFKIGKKREFRDADAAAAAKEARDARRERNSSVGIGATFCVLAFFLMLSSIPIMGEWYGQVHELILKESVTRENIAGAVAGCKTIRPRDGMLDFIKACQEHSPAIPVCWRQH